MKLYCICFLTLLLVSSCSKDDTPGVPLDTMDELTGTTWVRYGFKSPISGKDVYYYFAFKKNFQIDSYVKYNTDIQPEFSNTGTYTYLTGGKEGDPNMKIEMKGVTPQMATLQFGKLKIKLNSDEIIYFKE